MPTNQNQFQKPDDNASEHHDQFSLEELFNRMDEEQKLTFKKSVVQQTIYYITKQLPPPEQDEGERSFINLAKKWLQSPTEEIRNLMNAAITADYIDGGMRYFDYPAIFLQPAWAAGAKTGLEASEYALGAAEAIQQTALASEWQMAVAWAILKGDHLPVLEEN